MKNIFEETYRKVTDAKKAFETASTEEEKDVIRESVADAKSINKAAKSIRNAFECQAKGLGFSFVEVIVPCPTGLKMKVLDSYAWSAKEALGYFQPQVFKNELEQNREV